MTETELAPHLIRRVLVATGFVCCEDLLWGEDAGVLTIYADCSDFFDWATADCEPIESETDVELLEQCLADLQKATGKQHPVWLTHLYAARRRRRRPMSSMFGDRRYAMDAAIESLFLEITEDRP